MKNEAIIEVLKYLLASYALLPTAPVKNGKPPVKKPKTVKAATYTLKHSQRGRVPNWVLKQSKCKNKPALTKKFKDGHRFVLGS